jgi:hypothetical protein
VDDSACYTFRDHGVQLNPQIKNESKRSLDISDQKKIQHILSFDCFCTFSFVYFENNFHRILRNGALAHFEGRAILSTFSLFVGDIEAGIPLGLPVAVISISMAPNIFAVIATSAPTSAPAASSTIRNVGGITFAALSVSSTMLAARMI